MLNSQNRKIIPINKRERYSVEKLYYFSCPNLMPPEFWNDGDIRPSDVLFDVNALQTVRSKLLAHSSKKEFPKRIYISRAKASNRRKFNEDEVFAFLEKYDFKMVYPENYSVIDQISMFNNAEIIAGGSGAAFSNILFCNNTCKVIIFAKYKIPISIFSTIAKQIGAELLYVTQESNILERKSIHESFCVDNDKLNTIVTWLNI